MSAFDGLRHRDQGVEPDPRFARRLRAELEAALAPTIDLPERNSTVTDANEPTESTAAPADPAAGTGGPSVATGPLPYIAVTDAATAIEWYVSVLDAVETIRYVGDDGRVGHAEVVVGGGRMMISDEYPDFGARSPGTVGGTPVKLYVEVPDVDAVWERALTDGADGHRPPADQAYGRRACAFRDPFGHEWMVQTVTAEPTTDEVEEGFGGEFRIVTPDQPPVELGYVTLAFGDTDRARAFYGELFGWRTVEGASGPGFAHIDNTRLPMGMAPGDATAAPELFFAVDDLDAATQRVVALGGRVIDRPEYASGHPAATCEDDQGRRFTLIPSRYR